MQERAVKKNAGGRPTAFKPKYIEQARKLCELGATDFELADFFEISVRTIYRWQTQFPEFCQVLKAGKEPADDRVKRSLYRKAIGYSFEAVKIFQPKAGDTKPLIVSYIEHVPPDTTAAIFWLKNRRPAQWREKLAPETDGRFTLEDFVMASYKDGKPCAPEGYPSGRRDVVGPD
jgi:hypothetical protein